MKVAMQIVSKWQGVFPIEPDLSLTSDFEDSARIRSGKTLKVGDSGTGKTSRAGSLSEFRLEAA